MENRSWKAAIIGVGFIGEAHIEACRRVTNVEVCAVCDSNLEHAKEVASKWNIPLYYSDYQDVINNKDIDVVHIATSNNMHFPIAKAALEAGKHVICEKPLALNYQETKELAEIANRSGCVAAVTYNLRAYPLVQEMRARVQSGEFGRVLSVHGSYLQDWLLLDTDWSWRIDPILSGKTRATSDIGCHWMDMVEHITGKKITSLCANTKIFHPIRKKCRTAVNTFQTASAEAQYDEIPVLTEDYASVMLELEVGIVGNFVVSQGTAGRKNYLCMEIDCEKAALSWNGENPNALWIGYREKPNEILIKDPSLMAANAARYDSYPGGHAEGFPDTIKQTFHNYYRYLETKDAKYMYATFGDGAHGLALCEAVLKSNEKRTWVDVTE